MEYLDTPYTKDELSSEYFLKNVNFLEKIEKEMLGHEVFDHPFLIKFSNNEYTEEGSKFILSQFWKIVMPFTAAICKLMGNAPDIKSRFMLMDNLYEEMGGDNINVCHPFLYIKMLESIGISKIDLDLQDTISSIRILNDAIFDAVENKSFAVGCAWLGYGGELTIPNNFSYLVTGIKASFGDKVDMEFWGRHGERDQEHSNDATTVLAMNTNDGEYSELKQSVIDSLNIRHQIWNELEEICDSKYLKINDKNTFNSTVVTGNEKEYLSSEHKVLSEYYKALNSANISMMEENWSKEESATFTSPLGGIVRTHSDIISSHDELFSSPICIDVEYYDIDINTMNNGFIAVGRERGTMKILENTYEVSFRTSRVFIKEDGKLKQIHHHGSFDDLNMQNEIMQSLASL
ncbi:Alternative dihydrofolate reductase 3 [hydrothermal vent metagenome]|uniref:Alternative dihydrofolate reductase 3 n=1 Tax=hydrothermal vent metagenome TaxID=652676 RepID=A0A1W1CTM0_9ZZZZ